MNLYRVEYQMESCCDYIWYLIWNGIYYISSVSVAVNQVILITLTWLKCKHISRSEWDRVPYIPYGYLKGLPCIHKVIIKAQGYGKNLINLYTS